MTTRRDFLKNTFLGTAAMTLYPYITYGTENSLIMNQPKISLAQWSLHRAFQNRELDADLFPAIAKKDFSINAIEYVNGFYKDYANDETFWNQMKSRCEDEGVKSLLIMVDEEGDLGNMNEADRNTTVENHYKWIHAAKILGCHSIRVNAFGEGTRKELRTPLINGLGKLAAYGQEQEINVLVENHGLHTSDGAYIAGIIEEVNNPYLGTLPDFGNWCLNAEWGSTKNNQCSEVYDPYTGVADFLPHAKGVSAKSYNFDEQGRETILDYKRLLQLVKDSGFQGYIGIEYEGENLSEPEGIRATKSLIQQVWQELD